MIQYDRKANAELEEGSEKKRERNHDFSNQLCPFMKV